MPSDKAQESHDDPNEMVGFETSLEQRNGKLIPVITLVPRWLLEERSRNSVALTEQN